MPRRSRAGTRAKVRARYSPGQEGSSRAVPKSRWLHAESPRSVDRYNDVARELSARRRRGPAMELIVRLFPVGESSRARLVECLGPAPTTTSGRYPVALVDPVLPRILAAGATAEGYWVSGEAVF